MKRLLEAPVRLMFPEGVLLGALLVIPWFPHIFDLVEPRATLLLAAVGVGGLGIGWRFARGRVVHGLLVLGIAASLPVLLPGDSPALTLAQVLIPLNLAVIALLPDQGIVTRGGLLRMAALAAQAGGVYALLTLRPEGLEDPLATVAVPALGLEVESVVVAYCAAFAALLVLAAATRAAPARGALWATAGAYAAYTDYPGGLTYLVAAAGLALVVASLEDAHALAYRDALTGLPSRRALDELLDRTARNYTVAMVDVDHFKSFNDRHGHDVGDQVLRMVAARLREARGGARAFRYGGEEFTLVYRGKTIEEVRHLLDKVREEIETSEFVLRGPDRPKKKPKKKGKATRRSSRKSKTLSVTVSIGAAERNGRGRNSAEVLKAADEALYEAKEAGRNQVAAAAS